MQPTDDDMDFADVKGQESVKRALGDRRSRRPQRAAHRPAGHGQIDAGQAAARPFCRRSPWRKRWRRPRSTALSGCCTPGQALVTRRPFRAPHHTASDAGLLGGNINPTPGEISLAHHGVLFLDELPEFKRSVLETMRQPLEEGRVTISRAAGTMTFPVAVHAGGGDESQRRTAKCRRNRAARPREIQNYLGRISGPLLDRIDLHVEVPAGEVPRDDQRSARAKLRRRSASGSWPRASASRNVSQTSRRSPATRGWARAS